MRWWFLAVLVRVWCVITGSILSATVVRVAHDVSLTYMKMYWLEATRFEVEHPGYQAPDQPQCGPCAKPPGAGPGLWPDPHPVPPPGSHPACRLGGGERARPMLGLSWVDHGQKPRRTGSATDWR